MATSTEDRLIRAQLVEDALLTHNYPAPELQLAGAGASSSLLFDLQVEQVQAASQILSRGEYGVPTCACVHPKFVLVGTSNGLVLMFDHFGALRGTIPSASTAAAAVTSMDCQFTNQLVVGYSDGRVTLFDFNTKQVLKTMDAAAMDGNVVFCKLVRPMCAITVTSKGVVWITTYSKLFLVVSADRKCLFDGGVVLSCSAAHDESRLVAISIAAVTVVADLQDDVAPRIAHKWPVNGTGAPLSTCWSGGGGGVTMLARGQGHQVELLGFRGGGLVGSNNTILLPPDGGVVCAIEFLATSHRLVAALTDVYRVYVLDTTLGQVKGGYCDVSGHIAQIVVAQDVVPSNFQNSVVRGDEGIIYLLGTSELVLVKLQTWTRHVERLGREGQWPAALAVALHHYRDTVLAKAQSNEDVAMAVIRDGTRVAEVFLEFLAQVQLEGISVEEAGKVCDLCMEYAVSISRTDLVFSQVMETFSLGGQVNVFLERLVVHILHDARFGGADAIVSPEAMALLRAYLVPQRKREFELVVLHLEQVGLGDLDMLVKTLRDHELFTGLCYVYNRALSEYVAPFKAMVDCLARGGEGREEEVVGYRVLLYLKYCFLGIAFPRGVMPEQDQRACCADLLRALMQVEVAGVLIRFDAGTFARVVQTGLDSPFFEAPPSRDEVFRALLAVGEGRNVLLDLASAYAQRGLVRDEDLLKAVVSRLVHETRDEDAVVGLLEGSLGNALMGQVDVEVERDQEARGRMLRVRVLVHANEPNRAVEAYLESKNLEFAKLVFPYLASVMSDEERRKAILLHAERLVRLDCVQTCALVDKHEDVLRVLRGDGDLEFAFLEAAVGQPTVSDYVVERFLLGLVARRPDDVHAWLVSNEARYSLDLALRVCEGARHVDATAYLLERAGRPDEALDLVLAPNRPSMGMASAQVACELCARTSSEEMWLRVLDACAEQGDEEVVGLVLERMLPHVVLNSVLRRIQSDERFFPKYQKALAGVVMAFKLQLGALEAANRVARDDLFVLGERRRRMGGAGWKVGAGEKRDEGVARREGEEDGEEEWRALRFGAEEVDLPGVLLGERWGGG